MHLLGFFPQNICHLNTELEINLDYRFIEGNHYNVELQEMSKENHQQINQSIIKNAFNHDISTNQSESFYHAGLDSYFIRCLSQLGFSHPTPIQFHSILASVQHPYKSLISQSKSGTGKTLSYISIVYLHLLSLKEIFPKCYSVIILPTRQLALQVFQCFKNIQSIIGKVKYLNQKQREIRSRLKQITIMLSIGGIPFEDDKKKFITNGGNVVIGTIGRLIEIFEKNVVKTNEIQVLVLDEGDKLFESKNKKFTDLIERINNNKAKLEGVIVRKTRFLIYSATYNDKIIKELQKSRDFVYIQTLADHQNKLLLNVTLQAQKLLKIDNNLLQGSKTNESLINLDNIKKYKLSIQSNTSSFFSTKINSLIKILKELSYTRSLVFVEKKIFLEQINQRLVQAEFDPLLIHGSLSQSSRIKLMNQANTSKIIISSDLLARGIDLRLDLVILFDAKRNDTFWHRIGRTGRYGRTGVAVSLDNVQGWEQYDALKVQDYLNEIREDESDKKQYYGSYLTELGVWKDVQIQKQEVSSRQYKYFMDENLSEVNTKNIKSQIEYDQQKKPNKCLNKHKMLKIQDLANISSRQKLVEYVRNLMSCSICFAYVCQIQQLTGFTFQIRNLLK